jgi:hypothetical protein
MQFSKDGEGIRVVAEQYWFTVLLVLLVNDCLNELCQPYIYNFIAMDHFKWPLECGSNVFKDFFLRDHFVPEFFFVLMRLKMMNKNHSILKGMFCLHKSTKNLGS